MEINCVHNCHYQSEGKCVLNELPAFTQSIHGFGNSDCPYYTQRTHR